MQEYDRKKSNRKYSCPICREVIKVRPVEILTLKDIVWKFANLRGENVPDAQADPRAGNDRDCIWAMYFNY